MEEGGGDGRQVRQSYIEGSTSEAAESLACPRHCMMTNLCPASSRDPPNPVCNLTPGPNFFMSDFNARLVCSTLSGGTSVPTSVTDIESGHLRISFQ